MDRFKEYDIVFVGLKNGKHEYDFEITQKFFDLFDTEKEFDDAKVTVHVTMQKHTTFLEFEIAIAGKIDLVCDITNDTFNYPLKNDLKVLVKFGKEYDDSNEEVIIIPQQDYAFNIAQLIYEEVMLSVPMKKISPKVSKKDLQILELYSPKEVQLDEESENTTDPRWNALKKLK